MKLLTLKTVLALFAGAFAASSQTANLPFPVVGTLQTGLVPPARFNYWNAKQDALSLTNKLSFSFLSGVPPFLTLLTLPPPVPGPQGIQGIRGIPGIQGIPGQAGTTTALQGVGPLVMLGAVGPQPDLQGAPLGCWYDSTNTFDCVDQAGERSVMVRVSINGVSTNCAAGSVVTGFNPSGVPICTPLPVIPVTAGTP